MESAHPPFYAMTSHGHVGKVLLPVNYWSSLTHMVINTGGTTTVVGQDGSATHGDRLVYRDYKSVIYARLPATTRAPSVALPSIGSAVRRLQRGVSSEPEFVFRLKSTG